MIKQIKSSEIKNYLKENSNAVLLDVRTEKEWKTLGKPNAEYLNSKTYFVTVSHDLSNWQVPDPNFV
jgi:rhodanese-related sulfurtransferase